MRWPRTGILIRLLIYVPVLGFLSWRAFHAKPARDEGLEGRPIERRQIKGPDGTDIEVIELTREQFERTYGPLPQGGPGEPEAGGVPAAAKVEKVENERLVESAEGGH